MRGSQPQFGSFTAEWGMLTEYASLSCCHSSCGRRLLGVPYVRRSKIRQGVRLSTRVRMCRRSSHWEDSMKAISSVVCSVFLSSLLFYSQTTNTHNLTQSSPPAAVTVYRICSGGGYTS